MRACGHISSHDDHVLPLPTKPRQVNFTLKSACETGCPEAALPVPLLEFLGKRIFLLESFRALMSEFLCQSLGHRTSSFDARSTVRTAHHHSDGLTICRRLFAVYVGIVNWNSMWWLLAPLGVLWMVYVLHTFIIKIEKSINLPPV